METHPQWLKNRCTAHDHMFSQCSHPFPAIPSMPGAFEAVQVQGVNTRQLPWTIYWIQAGRALETGTCSSRARARVSS